MKIKAGSYLVETKNCVECIKKFSTIITGKALVVSREPTETVNKWLKKSGVSSLWLTEIQTPEEHISPKQIEQLNFTIENFMAENKGAFIILTGIEYIVSYTSFKEILHLVQHLRDVCIANKCIFIVNVGVSTLDSIEKNLLLQELVIFDEEYK